MLASHLGREGTHPGVSDAQPSAAPRIQFCRTAFPEVRLWDNPEDYSPGWFWTDDPEPMHPEEASAFWKMTSTPCEARDPNVTSHSTVTREKTATAVV